jgi:MOSC domain-containing protein YiiM
VIYGVVVSVNTSATVGTRKDPVGEAELVVARGLAGDAHAGGARPGQEHRQVSLLALESVDRMRETGLDVGPGAFAENLTTSGIDLPSLQVGTVLRVGDEAELEVSQIGKECHDRCDIFRQAGDCVMPREGIFAIVVRGGTVRTGDRITARG